MILITHDKRTCNNEITDYEDEGGEEEHNNIHEQPNIISY